MVGFKAGSGDGTANGDSESDRDRDGAARGDSGSGRAIDPGEVTIAIKVSMTAIKTAATIAFNPKRV